MNTELYVSFLIKVFIFFSYISRSGISGSNDHSIFNFLRSFHTVHYSACTNLYFHQQGIRVLFALYPCQYLLFVVFLIRVILTSSR